MILLFFKGIYQTVQIRLALFFSNIFAKPEDQYTLARKKLSERGFEWNSNRKTKVFAIFSVSNWELVLKESLTDLGEVAHFEWSNVKDFFPKKKDWLQYYNDLNAKLVQAFDNTYDANANILVFIYASDFSISPYSMQYMIRPNVLIVSFCWDDLLYFKGSVRQQPVGVRRISKYADVNLTMSPEAIPRYNNQHSACFFWQSLPIATNSAGLMPENSQRAGDYFYVLFIGSKYGWRGKFIDQLRKAGIQVQCYGAGWENGQLSGDAMKEAIHNAPVTLGFANVGYTRNITTIKGRDFEVPLWGGLYLTQYSEGLVKYYELGKEVFAYHTFSECLQILQYIKNNRTDMEGIRLDGYRKASQLCSWKSRFAYLSQLISELTI